MCHGASGANKSRVLELRRAVCEGTTVSCCMVARIIRQFQMIDSSNMNNLHDEVRLLENNIVLCDQKME